jgi:hypothetical protein
VAKTISEEAQTILEGRTRTTKDGRRHLAVSKRAKAELAEHAIIEEAVAMFLDLEHDMNNKQIAERLGLSTRGLKTLTQSAEFTRLYEEALAMLGHSPRLMATSQALPDLLPAAYRTLRRLVTESEVPDAVALKAAERILAVNRVGAERNDEDPRDLAKFLEVTGTKVDGNLNILQFNIPDVYKQMFEQAFQKVPEVIDAALPQGEIVTLEDMEQPAS